MTETEQMLWDATKTGQYPAGTTAQNLANAKKPDGRSALHDAARAGHYPPGTTTQDLANVKNKDGYTVLHLAAWYGNYPPGTTAQDLAEVKDPRGWSALHEAGFFAHLPPNTTSHLLKTTITNQNAPVWKYLCSHLKNNPTYALDLPPHLFQEDNNLAITTVQEAIQKDRSLQSKGAIWLGKIFAEAQTKTQHAQTIPTP